MINLQFPLISPKQIAQTIYRSSQQERNINAQKIPTQKKKKIITDLSGCIRETS